ncbi:F-box protein CPR1 [Linum grandiflorum]
MSAGEKFDDDRSSATYYFPEHIVINILQWLPTLSCIGRFRCVCRSWRNLLSDPNVIRKIIFHKSSDDQKKFQVLISGRRHGARFSSVLYSIYSYETLRPIEELVTPVELEARVVGCCDGIFCLARTTRDDNGNYHHNTVLWNPATSEIKIIPPGPYHPCHSSRVFLYLRAERTGFGYDPKTDDYKVVRVMEFEDSTTEDDDIYQYHYDSAQFYYGPTPLIFTEVYSLKNDSWKTLNVATHSAVDKYIYDTLAHEMENLNQQWDNSRNQKCYWFRREESPGICAVISFDMSTEMFEFVTFPHPTSLTHHEEDIVVCNSSIGEHGNDWYVRSHFMLKGVIMLRKLSYGFTNLRFGIPLSLLVIQFKIHLPSSHSAINSFLLSSPLPWPLTKKLSSLFTPLLIVSLLLTGLLGEEEVVGGDDKEMFRG